MYSRSDVRRPRTTRWVRGSALALSLLVCSASRCGTGASVPDPSIGVRALELTNELVAFGPRPPGSPGLERVRQWIGERVAASGFSLARDRFMAETPLGPIEMQNLSYVIPGRSSAERFVLVAHYESKRFVGIDFVGANDAASSVALLLAISPEIARRRPPFDTEVVFVDGEEALVSWSATDGLYGSRRLAERLREGRPVRLAVVVDMVGDKDLRLVRDRNLKPEPVANLERVLASRGWSGLLDPRPIWIEDDHTPLLRAGIPTIHLMDFTYGGRESPGFYWHTAADTVDKLSATSLSLAGEIVLDLLK